MNFFFVGRGRLQSCSCGTGRGYQLKLYEPRKIDIICYCNLIIRDQYNEAVYLRLLDQMISNKLDKIYVVDNLNRQ